MFATDLKVLDPNMYYIVVYNTSAYAEGITGRNYNMKIFYSSKEDTTCKGWKNKKDLASTLSLVKKSNKSYKKPDSAIGEFNTIKVMKVQDMVDDLENNRYYTTYFIDSNKLVLIHND